jgi:CelD/BcsL family acetyltransferase involved in cellulose biosynthesis
MSYNACDDGTELALSAAVLRVEDAYPLWSGFADTDPFGVAQMLAWVRGWKDCVNPELFVATLSDGERPLMLLPLEIVHEKGSTIARYVGGSHANANFPLLMGNAAAKIKAGDIQSLFAEIKIARPQLDALVLTRQVQDFGGIANPLLQAGSSESPNLSLSFKLGPDFEALAKQRGWSRKQKKMRNQARRLEGRGGWACLKSDSAQTTLQLIDASTQHVRARDRQKILSQPIH